jgi:hypothetical protein
MDMQVQNDYRRVMWATEAHHLMGDISRREGDFAMVYVENIEKGELKIVHDPEYGPCWVGNWITGLGFIEVRFPVATTRDLTWVEAEVFESKTFVTL